MKLVLLISIMAFTFKIAAEEPESESTPESRAKFMAACDFELATKHMALQELVFELIFVEADLAQNYNDAHEAYTHMKTCDDFRASYLAYSKIAKYYRNDSPVETYWETEEGQRNLKGAADYLRQSGLSTQSLIIN